MVSPRCRDRQGEPNHRRKPQINADEHSPAFGRNQCVQRFVGAGGEQVKPGDLQRLLGSAAMPRVKGALPIGTSNALNANFTFDMKGRE